MARVPLLYTEHDTVLHRRDPRIKILLFLLLLAYLFMAPSWYWMAGLTGVGAVLCVVARVPVKLLAWALLIVQLPNFLGVLLLPIAPDLFAGTLQYDAELASGLKLVFAWAGALLVSFSLFSTMTVDELTQGLRGVGVPAAGVFAVGYSFLLLYLSLSDLFRIIDALKGKGVDLETRNPFRLLASLPRLMIPVLFTTVRRGTAMIAVLEMRGFSFTKARQQHRRAKFDVGDAVTLLCGLVVFGLVLGSRYELLPSGKVREEKQAQSEQQPGGTRQGMLQSARGVAAPTGPGRRPHPTPAKASLQGARGRARQTQAPPAPSSSGGTLR